MVTAVEAKGLVTMTKILASTNEEWGRECDDKCGYIRDYWDNNRDRENNDT